MAETATAKPSSSAAAIAIAERKEKETKRTGHLYVMASVAYAAIREFQSSVGAKELNFWDDLSEEDQEFWKTAAKWVMAERNVTPNAADLQDAHPVAGVNKPYKQLTLEQRTRVFLFCAIIKAFMEMDDRG